MSSHGLPLNTQISALQNFKLNYQLIKHFNNNNNTSQNQINVINNVDHLKQMQDAARNINKISRSNEASLFSMFKNEFTWTNNYKSYQPFVIDQEYEPLPIHITNPPPLSAYDNTVQFDHLNVAFIPNDKLSAYPPNFKVDFGSIIPGRPYNTHTPYTEEKRKDAIHRGLGTAFTKSYKERSTSLKSSFILLAITYLCHECKVKQVDGCFCFTKSYALRTLLDTIEPNKGMPFFFSSKVSGFVKSDQYTSINSQLPYIWGLFLELGLRSLLGVNDQAFEACAVKYYLSRASVSLVGTFLVDKSFKKYRDYALTKVLLNNYTVSDEGTLTKIITGMPYNDDTSPEPTEVIAAFQLDRYFKPLTAMDDTAGRAFFSALRIFASPPSYVHAQLLLNFPVSGRGTGGSGPMLHKINKVIQILDQEVPMSITYADPDVQAVFDLMVTNLNKYGARIDNLEESYLINSTTRSAGLSPDELKTSKEIIQRMNGGLPDELLESSASKRIVSTIMSISKIRTLEAYLEEFNSEGLVGVRHQIYRRPRPIIMVKDGRMKGPFIQAQVCKQTLLKSKYASTGKNIGDIRDSITVIQATGEFSFASSMDVAGMDTSTHMPQRHFVGLAVIQYLRLHRSEHNSFYINKDANGRTMPVRVHTRDITGEISTEEISLLEWLTYVDFTTPTTETTLKTDMQDRVKASSVSFPSGAFNTSTQHTMIMSHILEHVSNLALIKFPASSIRPRGNVLGDDLFTAAFGPASPAKHEYNVWFVDKVHDVLKKFGYDVDPEFKYAKGEFLKQTAIAGAPDPEHTRTLLFGSERSDTIGATPLEKFVTFKGILGEISSRVPSPEYTTSLLYVGSWLIGYDRIRFSAGSMVTRGRFNRISTQKARLPAGFDKLISSGHVDVWKDRFNQDVYDVTFPLLWACAPMIGVPFPKFTSGGETFNKGSYLTFASPASIRRLLMIGVHNIDINEAVNHELNKLESIGLQSYMNQASPTTSRTLNRHANGRDLDELIYTYRASPRSFPLDFAHLIDLNIYNELGITFGWNASSLYASSPSQKSLDSLALSRLRKLGNSYLDSSKVIASQNATRALLDLGIKISDDDAYYNRIGTKINSALIELTPGKLGLPRLVDAFYRRPKDFTEVLQHGAYIITSKPINYSRYSLCDVFTKGYGPAVPPYSIQSYYLTHLGLPPVDAISHAAVSFTVAQEVKDTRIASSVIATARRAYLNRGGRNLDSLDLAITAMQLSPANAASVKNLVISMGGIGGKHYAFSNRLSFYYNGNPDFLAPDYKIYDLDPTRVKGAIHISEIMYSPEMLTLAVDFHSLSGQW